MNLQDLEKQSIEELKNSTSKSKNGFDSKSVLIELLTKSKMTKDLLKIKGATLWFTEIKVIPSLEKYKAKQTTIGNSFDTMKSNFNFPEKIAGDDRLKDYKWNENSKGEYWLS